MGFSEGRLSTDKLINYLGKPLDGRPIAAFRIVFGAILFILLVRMYWLNLLAINYLIPQYHFSYSYLFFLPRPTWGLVWGFFSVLLVSSIFFILGFFYRLASIGLLVGWGYFFLLDRALYSDTHYLVFLVVLMACFIPANNRWSLDKLLRGSSRTQICRFHLLGLWSVFGIKYFYSGIFRINYDWLHGQPLGILLSSRLEFLGVTPTGWYPVVGLALAHLILVTTLLAFPALVWERTRSLAIASLLVFHLFNGLLYLSVLKPAICIGSLVLFVEFPDDRVVNAEERSTTLRIDRSKVLSLIAISLLVLVQCLLPLRPFFYPGTVLWNQFGAEFSWMSPLSVHSGTLGFRLSDPTMKPLRLSRSNILKNRLLNARQFNEVMIRPSLILEFSKFLSQTWANHNTPLKAPAVQAASLVSLNARIPTKLIDSSKDLRRIHHSAEIVWPNKEPLPEDKNLILQVSRFISL